MFYSHFFSTLHDEQAAVGSLGARTHYSVLRAVLWTPKARFHDFAVIWDEDHDLRIVWVIEQMFVADLLADVVFIGERKGGVTVITRTPPSAHYAGKVEAICSKVPSDSFNSECGDLDPETHIERLLINDRSERVLAYLRGIDALWELGPKEARFTTAPYDEEPA
jgi:hypothetical protein